MSDDVVATPAPRTRRAADDAPMLRAVVDALIDGDAPSSAVAAVRRRSPLDRRMTRQLLALEAIATPTVRRPSPLARARATLGALLRAGMPSRAALVRAATRGDDAVAMASLASAVHGARSAREVAAALVVHLADAIDTTMVAVLAPASETWRALAGPRLELPADSAVAALLSSAADTARVDPASSLHALLPPSDRAWLLANRVATLVSVQRPDGTPLAGVLLGPPRGGGWHARHDLACLLAAARMAAVALDARPSPAIQGGPTDPPDDLAFECDRCGRVSDDVAACACGGTMTLAALPLCLRRTYAVERRIGRGGTGVVYLARDTRLERPVALKTMPCLTPQRASAIREEARVMAAVAHPTTAVLYGVEEWHDTPVLVVEYMPGGTLASRLAAAPVPPGDALNIGTTLAAALAALHARGCVHGDVKPANIGFDAHGAPRLLDFGLTHWACDRADEWASTREGPPDEGVATPLAGTPLYLSPDVLDGLPVRASDDVWALAVVIVEMVTGVHPFAAPTRADVLRRIRAHDGLDMDALARHVPAAAAAAVARALHPNRSRRVADASQLAELLRGAAIAV